MSVGAPLLPDDPVEVGRYRLLRRLGVGGFGLVYLASATDGEKVAIKVLSRSILGADMGVSFSKEIRAASRVAAFCTARIISAETNTHMPHIVSEYIPGPTLQQHILANGLIVGGELERLAIGTMTALAVIHRAGVAHLDLKPSNVILGPDGPRVIDFGIARALDATLTVEGPIIGTPSYMAPEQIASRNPGSSADLFAWASTITFAATGQPPFGNGPAQAIMYRILHDPPSLAPLRGFLGDLITDCLVKDPSKRPSAERALLRLLGYGVPTALAIDTALTRGMDIADSGPPTLSNPDVQEQTRSMEKPWRGRARIPSPRQTYSEIVCDHEKSYLQRVQALTAITDAAPSKFEALIALRNLSQANGVPIFLRIKIAFFLNLLGDEEPARAALEAAGARGGRPIRDVVTVTRNLDGWLEMLPPAWGIPPDSVRDPEVILALVALMRLEYLGIGDDTQLDAARELIAGGSRRHGYAMVHALLLREDISDTVRAAASAATGNTIMEPYASLDKSDFGGV